MSLCKYKNIFGEPNTGIHSVRFFNIAIIDVIGTIIGSLILQVFIIHVFDYYINLSLIALVCFSLGILLHRLFCVRTTIDKLLFKE